MSPVGADAIEVEPLGDRAVRFAIPAHVGGRALLARLRALPGVRDVVITETHACVCFEGAPRAIDASLLAVAEREEVAPDVRVHVVESVFDGPDLDEAAALAGLHRDLLIARLEASELTCSFVGFMPGFAYLRGLDEALGAIPRRASPRPRVPAGSIAIAGGFAGIYPFDSPGGWQLVGRAIGWAPFASDAARVSIGDRVRFVASPARRS